MTILFFFWKIFFRWNYRLPQIFDVSASPPPPEMHVFAHRYIVGCQRVAMLFYFHRRTFNKTKNKNQHSNCQHVMPRLGNIVAHVQTINDTKTPATLAYTSFFPCSRRCRCRSWFLTMFRTLCWCTESCANSCCCHHVIFTQFLRMLWNYVF